MPSADSSQAGRGKVLLVAPQPFFVERGTPLNVRALAESLSSLGYEVDILAYPLGADLEIPGVDIIRGYPFPGISEVPAGPSWRKVFLDITLFLRGFVLLFQRRYNLFHGIEEGAFMAGLFGFLTRTPYVVDLDSCMEAQLEASGFMRSKTLLALFSRIERAVMRRSAGVLTVCQALTQKAQRLAVRAPIHQIEDFPVESSACVDEARVQELKERFGVNDSRVIVYTGNFQSYQGLDLLVEALNVLYRDEEAKTSVRTLLVGGEGAGDPLIDAYKQRIAEYGIEEFVTCTGPLPMAEMGNVMAMADVLVSPRSEGGNTPLKIYSYMASGRAIVATDLETHTQVLNRDTAILAEPNAQSYGNALRDALRSDPESRRALEAVGQAAKQLVAERYSRESFVRRVGEFYQEVLGRSLNGSRPAAEDDEPRAAQSGMA